MEQNKDNFLCKYMDSLGKPELIILNGKKIPSLNEYAENYLANLNNEKYNNDLNNNNKLDDYNDKSLSAKSKTFNSSNNNSFIANNLNNQILKSNENGNINCFKYEDRKIENKEIKNNLYNEHLKNNSKKESESSEGIGKEKDINIKINNDINYLSWINLDEYYNQNKMFLSEIYKKISPLNTRVNSPLFSSFKTSETNYSRNVKMFENNQNNKLNFSKSLISLNNSRNNKNSSFFSRKKSSINNLKINSSLTNKLTSYLSNRDYFYKVKNQKINIKKKKNNFHLKFSDYTSNDESLTPFYITNRANTSHSQSIKDYWKEKEIKKQIKIEKIRKERRLKESEELRDRPKINPNSRKIANKINNHSSINVFDRLFELKKQFIFNERRFNTKIGNNNKVDKNIIKEKNYHIYLRRNKNGFDINNEYKSLKQIEKINKKLIEKNKKEKMNNSSMHNNTKLHKNNSQRQGHNFKIENKKSSLSNIKTLMKKQNCLNESYNKDINLIPNNKANSKKDIFLPKIMYKRNKTRKNCIKNEELTEINNNENKSLNSKFINNDKILIDYNFKGNNNEISNEKKNQKVNPIRIQIRNFNDTKSYNRSSKNIKGLSFLNPNYIDLNTYDNYRNNTNNNDMITQNFEHNNYYNRNGYDLNDKNYKLNTEIYYNGKTYNTKAKKLDEGISKMFMTKLYKNKKVEIIKNISNNNKNMINTKKYFILPKKTDINKDKSQQVIFNKDYLNKINSFIFNDKIEKDIIDSNKSININWITCNELNNEAKENNKKIANIPYNKNRNHDIKRRKLDLLKILNFSSSIGMDYNTHK